MWHEGLYQERETQRNRLDIFMLGLMKSGQSWRDRIGTWGQWNKPGKLGKACLLGFFLAFLCLQRQIYFRSQEGHPSHEGFMGWVRGKDSGGQSEWLSCFYCFLRLLQLKIFHVLSCHIWGYEGYYIVWMYHSLCIHWLKDILITLKFGQLCVEQL